MRGASGKASRDLLTEALAALRAGRSEDAMALVLEAQASAPADPAVRMQKALVHRMSGAFHPALAAVEEALALDPHDFLALLTKGALVEKTAGERAAARVYEDALKLAPPDAALLPGLRAPTERARAVVARVRQALLEHLTRELGDVAAAGSGLARQRLEDAVGVFAGTRRVHVQEPLLFHYPQLPAIPFYPRELFPWLPELEAAAPVITAELTRALDAGADGFAPYMAIPDGAPVNQWGELNHSPRWSSLFLWKDGVRQDAVCAAFPQTSAVIEGLPLMHQEGFAPTAVFSALEAHTHIPAHTGSTNVRLLCHLPLILPGPARFRVGAEERPWRDGEAWVFDDTIEHEAWNDAGARRVILILDVWNPFLEPEERRRVSALMRARNAFYHPAAPA